MIWPSSRILAIANESGANGALLYLNSLVDRWLAASPAVGRAIKAQAEDLARLVLRDWSPTGWDEPQRAKQSVVGRMCETLLRLREPALVELMAGRLAAAATHPAADNAAIVDAIDLLADDVAASWLAKIAAAHGSHALGASAGLLRLAVQGRFAKNSRLLLPAAEALVATLPGDPDKLPKDRWGQPRQVALDAEGVVALVPVIDHVDADVARRAAAHMLAWLQHFGIDAAVIPALKKLVETGHRTGRAFEALHGAAVDHLGKRIAEPLEPPTDWRRPGEIRCDCAHCKQLSRFLLDPNEPVWTLHAAQQIRTHVEDSIRRASADVDCQTVRRGSPHSLVCTKNQAGHRRHVARRKRDLADLAILQGAAT